MKEDFKTYVCLIIAAAISCSVQAQNRPTWLDPIQREVMYPGKTHIVVVDSLDTSRKKEDRLKDESELKELVYAELAQSIMTQVQLRVESSVRETAGSSGQSYSNSFSSSSSYLTEVELSNAIYKKWESDKPRRLFALVAIKTQALAEILMVQCKEELRALNSTLQAHFDNASAIDVFGVQQDFEQIKSKRTTAISLGSPKSEEYSLLVEEYNQIIARLRSSKEQKEQATVIAYAQQLFQNGEFEACLLFAKDQLLINRGNKKLKDIQSDALAAYKEQVLTSIVTLEAQSQFLKAAQSVQSFLHFDPRDQEMQLKLKDLRGNAFRKSVANAQAALKAQDLPTLEAMVNTLEGLADIDPNVYADLKVDLEDLKIQREKERVHQLYLKKDYAGAWSHINGLEQKYGRLDELEKDRKRISYKLYRRDLSALKKERPHTWSVMVGSDLISVPALLEKSATISTSALFSYRVGIYKKLRIKPNFSLKGRDISSADYIGAVVRVLDYRSQFVAVSDGIEAPRQPGVWGVEIGVSAVQARVIHLEAGTRLAEATNYQNWEMMYLSLGLRLPFGRLAFLGDARVETEFAGYGYVRWTLGASWRVDFKRRVSPGEKKALRMEY